MLGVYGEQTSWTQALWSLQNSRKDVKLIQTTK